MARTRPPRVAQRFIIACLVGTLAACAVAPPRTDDPMQNFNRKMFAFNRFADKVAIRPAAKAYVKITGPKERILIGNFFSNLRTPITIINEVLQGRPVPALQSTGRFVINTTLGFLGVFDPASEMKLPEHPTDFAVTLAHWGVPEGPFLVLPFIGPTTARDVWRLPVDSYFDPLSWYARDHDLKWNAQYLPGLAYLVTLRARALPLDSVLDTAYDPYAFMRDAYRQNRLNEIYYGNPPLSAIEELQGTSPSEEDGENLDQLLKEQKAYEKSHGIDQNGVAAPAAPASSAALQPAPAPSSIQPPPASSAA
ncbi:MAG TPA: VacJ family lipoprotein [Rhodanobacteraceae bacterium]|nr:VacJ family lipoprotein [Rhodanobacteraceae bacterium]